jgi:hypothetical protein
LRIADREACSWWYFDGVTVERCAICLARRDEVHRQECPFGLVIALVAALVESDAPMGLEDTDRVLALAELVGVPTVGPEFD